jgi:HAD superfamily hydrolase (TIGR01509 family)
VSRARSDCFSARAVVFDLDGVLVASEHVNVASARQAFARFGHVLPDDATATIVGRHPADYVPELAARVGLAEDAIVELMRFQDGVYRSRWAREVRLIDGADQTVRTLGRLGIRLGLATSAGRAHVEACLDRFHLRDVFLALVSKDDVRRRKPDPEAYTLAAYRLDVAPSEAIAVEDSPHGIRAAVAAGMKVIAIAGEWVPRERLEEADAVVDRIAEVVGRVRPGPTT